MNSSNIKKIIKGICFLVIFAVLFWYAQRVLQAKWASDSGDNTASTSTWNEFRTLEKNTVDVLFAGTSHTYFGVDPMYIYEKSGITSYAFGGPGLRLDLTYMLLKDAYKTQSPSVIFLDVSAIQFDFQQSEGKCHKVADQLPLSLEKLEYAFNNEEENMKPLDVLFPLFRYHSRWSDLKKKDFKYAAGNVEPTYIRGHYITYQNKTTRFHFEEEADYYLTDRNRDYMNRIADLCRKHQTQLILFKIPTPTWYRAQSEGAAELAAELGLPWMELYYDVDEIGLNVQKDFKDRNNHLNQRGAEKLSAYLVKYMQENLDLIDHRDSYMRWNEDLKQYQKLKKHIYKKNQ